VYRGALREETVSRPLCSEFGPTNSKGEGEDKEREKAGWTERREKVKREK
jgi:hypothetical protein